MIQVGLAPGYEAWIISVGNELLIGRIVNTNASWLGRRLTLLGYKVRRGLVVPDELEDIAWAFKIALRAGAKVVISTGGLGPTFDDKTAEGLALALEVPLELNEDALRMVEEKYRSRGYELTPPRLKMAKLPKGAKPIPNPVGTAPGIHVSIGDQHIFALPGVPREMEAMFDQYVEPFLRQIGPRIFFAEKLIKVIGVPESEAAPLIEKVMRKYAQAYIKSHPRMSELEGPHLLLHVTVSSTEETAAKAELERLISELLELFRKKGAKIELVREGG